MIRMEQQMLKELVARELPNFSPTIDDARVGGGNGPQFEGDGLAKPKDIYYFF